MTIAPHRLRPLLTVALAAVCALATVDASAAPSARRRARVDRRAAFKASLRLDGWQKQTRFIPASRGGKALPTLRKGEIKIKALGKVIVMRRYSAARKDGVRGLKVEQWVKLRQPKRSDGMSGKAHSSLRQAVKLLDQRFELGQTSRAKLHGAAIQGVLSAEKQPRSSTEAYRLAMKAAAASLGDKYTKVFDPVQHKAQTLRTHGKTLGVGVRFLEGQLGVLARVQKEGPAAGKLRVGDKLLTVNGAAVTSNQGAFDALKGEANSRVRVTLERAGQRKQLTLERKEFKVSQVSATLLGKTGVGLVKLNRFTVGCAGEVHQAITKLKRQAKGQLEGLVLDFRGNPGGQSKEATKLLDGFIAKGAFVRYTGFEPETHAAQAKTLFPKLKLAVLLDKKSASASERTAGVLKQHKRATILGEKSFGKGIRQSTFNLADGSSVKITTAKMLLPDPKTGQELYYHGKGLVPDVNVAQAKARFPNSKDPVALYAAGLLAGKLRAPAATR
jgi:carboxyl-terminal processing protease